ncbi:RNA-directed DNA polymerase, eukaryota, reverse transcriptase zinc-binding domain protein, partial [Tanacetum coccineum]
EEIEHLCKKHGIWTQQRANMDSQDVLRRSIMGEIDISTLTLEQDFRLIDENHAPGMVNEEFGKMMEKDIEDMTIDVGSFHLKKNKTSDYLYYTDDAKINAYYDLPPLLPCFKHIQPYTKHKNESYKTGLDEEINYVSNGELVMSEQGTIDKTDAPNVPNLEPDDEGMRSNDDVDECKQKKTSKTDIVLEVSSMASNNIVEEDSHGMASMTQQAPLGTMENVLFRIDKIVFPYNFVVINMLEILSEMMILGKPFLATIHTQIDVLNEKISFGIREDRVKFDEKCELNHGGTTYAWHNKGHEEEELWKFGIEKAEYAPPIVNVETFEVKRYSFTGGRSFIYITKQFDDALPLGRANWSQFAIMIIKELVIDKNAKEAT